MPNTSATGGYLLQGDPKPIEGQALRRFLHGLLVGVSGLPTTLVRPSWQPNPPPIPDIDTDWLAFGISAVRPEAGDPYYRQLDTGEGLTIRHEAIDVACTFYGPNAVGNAGALRDGMYIGQNRENLYLAGMGLVGFSDTIHAPELINDRFFDRADITMTLRREVRRTYPILHFVAAYGAIHANRAITTLHRDWEVNP